MDNVVAENREAYIDFDICKQTEEFFHAYRPFQMGRVGPSFSSPPARPASQSGGAGQAEKNRKITKTQLGPWYFF